MFTKLILAANIIIYYFATAAVIRSGQYGHDSYPIDCSVLNECNNNVQCIEFLISLYRLDCFSGQVSKKSFGGDKRAGLKNLKKIFLGSYMTRMR